MFNLKFKGGRLEYEGESISLDLLFLLSGLTGTSRSMDDNRDYLRKLKKRAIKEEE